MGRNLHYRPGSFYRVDDRTGFPQRAERTRKQWDGIIVDQTVWEPRQPQDLVRGVKDDQTVPEARPLAPNLFVGPIYVQTTAGVPLGERFIPLATVQGLSEGDEIGVMLDLDGGVLFNTGIVSISADGVLAYDPMPGAVSSGNLIVDYRRPFTPHPILYPYILTENLSLLATEDGRLLIQE